MTDIGRLRELLVEASDEIEFLAARLKQPDEIASDLVDRIRAALDATDPRTNETIDTEINAILDAARIDRNV